MQNPENTNGKVLDEDVRLENREITHSMEDGPGINKVTRQTPEADGDIQHV